MKIIRSNISHLDELSLLFDAYRCFYKQSSDQNAAKTFISQRLINKDSIIFIAFKEETAVGFTQLYPLFSSVSMQPMLLLNDLFIETNYRDLGIGTALIQSAMKYCIANKLKGMAIQTEVTNRAQNLYTRMGFKLDPDLHLFWKIDQNYP